MGVAGSASHVDDRVVIFIRICLFEATIGFVGGTTKGCFVPLRDERRDESRTRRVCYVSVVCKLWNNSPGSFNLGD